MPITSAFNSQVTNQKRIPWFLGVPFLTQLYTDWSMDFGVGEFIEKPPAVFFSNFANGNSTDFQLVREILAMYEHDESCYHALCPLPSKIYLTGLLISFRMLSHSVYLKKEAQYSFEGRNELADARCEHSSKMSSASANYFSTAIFGQSQEKRALVLPVTSPVGDLSSSSCPPTTQGSGSKNANGLPSKSVNSTPDGGNSDFKNKYTPFPPTTHSISPSSPSPRFRDWLRPSKMTSSVSALLDVWIPWLTYLGIGIGSENFVVGGLVAAGVAITGFIFQAFRFYYQRTLRTWPKPQAVGILMTWVGNAVYVSRIASNKETASVSICMARDVTKFEWRVGGCLGWRLHRLDLFFFPIFPLCIPVAIHSPRRYHRCSAVKFHRDSHGSSSLT